MTSSKKVLLILGAGASHAHWNGNGDPRPEWTPPLAAHLFGGHPRDPYLQDRKNSFVPVLQDYPGANVVAGDLAQRELPDDFAFEKYLLRVSQNDVLKPHYFDVPLYIRDIVRSCSEEFGQFSGNLTTLITGLSAFENNEVFVVSLNYDTLLEQDLQRLFPTLPPYKHVDDYVGEERPVKLIKLHGSVNWFRRMFHWSQFPSDLEQQSTRQIFDQYGFELMDEEIIVDDSIAWAGSAKSTVNRVDIPMYPTLTAPLANKTADSLVLPRSHEIALTSFMQQCDKILVVGTSGHDEDLLELLSSGINDVDKAHYVVGTTPEVKTVPERFESAVPKLGLAKVRRAFQGFGPYLKSEEFRSFARN